MLREKHNIKLTGNQRSVLDYIIMKAEAEHSLTVECPVPELQKAFQFNSNKTAYNIVNQLIEKGLIKRLADEISLNPTIFTFQRDGKDKKSLRLKYMLQELKAEKEVFPFLEPDKRVNYFKTISACREIASKIDYELTKDICRLADKGIFEFELQPIQGRPAVTVPHCIETIATYDLEEFSTFKTYEKREMLQAVDYLKTNPDYYLSVALNCCDYSNDFIKHLFNKYVFADVTE